MIKINLLDSTRQALNRAIANAINEIQFRSFSGRHPDLGKMINCQICNHRHRDSIKCEPKYSVDKKGKLLIATQKTARGVLGASHFAKKRFHPHINKKNLQLVERTRELYPTNEPYLSDPTECMKESRKQAARSLRTESAIKRKNARRMQKDSRRINLNLLPDGHRSPQARLLILTTETRQKRLRVQKEEKI